jgi:Reverse transcriptase (RNA-dependent DNA polymerase)
MPRPSETAKGQKWLGNFPLDDVSVARVLLDSVHIVSETIILNQLSNHFDSYAYQKDKSIKQCASRHLGARWLVKVDLHNFFHSINERSVFDVFVEVGYSRLVALELSRLCTREASYLGWRRFEHYATGSRRYTAIPQYRASELGFVPQGAPTSGALANQVVRPLDEELAIIAASRRLVYTRYADDIAFSADEDFSRERAIEALRAMSIAVTRYGDEYCSDKIWLRGPPQEVPHSSTWRPKDRPRTTCRYRQSSPS